jgi:hypothetical protein
VNTHKDVSTVLSPAPLGLATLKLARTCADLAAAPEIRSTDVAGAVQLRALDKLTC